MEKPLNKFARIIWGLLAAYVLTDAVYFITSRFYTGLLPQDFALQLLQSTIYAAVVFGSAAVLIELVDQIRWNALPPDKRESKL